MTKEEPNQLEEMLASVAPTGFTIDDRTMAEPLTYHRRGHWFEPSIAHHLFASETAELS